ncbi:UxaA family hydrolase [Pectinatus frisingensis]|uniref:UxaA family hydrolase n=1 Tax=Pectinatus frisingensis TaxID=865 RepID=UPI0018C45320|nr:altronate dehydratase family protein [Pectinatus frisingensis]
MKALQISKLDNTAVALENLSKGNIIKVNNREITLLDDICIGHKFALDNIKRGENIVKYGFPIGHASENIFIGAHIHTHNLKTNLKGVKDYKYDPVLSTKLPIKKNTTFMGYRRDKNIIGIRNNILIVPTVNCVTSTVRYLERKGRKLCRNLKNIDDCIAVTHPYGCSQIGDDYHTTQRILADIVNHPNAGAVLVVGLGCENNNIDEFKKALGNFDGNRVKFLVTQEVKDENDAGEKLLLQLARFANQYTRTACHVSELRVGLKCGGSDGLSGITANPLIGALSDLIIASGGSTVLTEVPEMFGAESILMNRAIDKRVFNKTVALINNFKKYFQRYGQVIYDNPSPGNKKGGITTLEDKSLGCVQKGGQAAVKDVLCYGDILKNTGLNLLNGPGNDSVSTTALAACGCQLILFSTGRGTPWGTMVPVIKIATNDQLASYKSKWIDFNAGRLLNNISMDNLRDELFDLIIKIASGQLTKSEQMDFHEIAIMKDGVTE